MCLAQNPLQVQEEALLEMKTADSWSTKEGVSMATSGVIPSSGLIDGLKQEL
jgi:hypothetical protein